MLADGIEVVPRPVLVRVAVIVPVDAAAVCDAAVVILPHRGQVFTLPQRGAAHDFQVFPFYAADNACSVDVFHLARSFLACSLTTHFNFRCKPAST